MNIGAFVLYAYLSKFSCTVSANLSAASARKFESFVLFYIVVYYSPEDMCFHASNDALITVSINIFAIFKAIPCRHYYTIGSFAIGYIRWGTILRKSTSEHIIMRFSRDTSWPCCGFVDELCFCIWGFHQCGRVIHSKQGSQYCLSNWLSEGPV